MKRKLAFALVSAATLAVAPAFADDAAPAATETTTTTTATATAAPAPAAGGEKEFGDSGVIAFAAATSLDLSTTSEKPPQGDSGSRLNISLLPSIDYFVAQNISIGAELLVNYQSAKAGGAPDATTTTAFGIGPRVGYNLWLTPGSLSLWPQVSFLYVSASSKTGSDDKTKSSSSIGRLGIFVPLEIHPVKHFHFGIGPYLDLDVMSKASVGGGDSQDGNKATTIGIKAEIGGWL